MTTIVSTSQLITADFVAQLNTNFEVLDAAVDAMQAGSFATLASAGSLTVGTTLGVTGAATFNSTLNVTGTTTLSAALTGTTGNFSSDIIVGIGAGTGKVKLTPSGSTGNTGYISFLKADNTRVGYLGFLNTAVAYVAELASSFHQWYGPASSTWMVLNGSATSASVTLGSVAANGLLQHDGTDFYVRAQNGRMFLGAAGANYITIGTAGFVSFAAANVGRGAPVTKTADFTVGATENWLINNKAAATCTVTLPAAASFPGREIMIRNIQAFTVVSASSNVVPLVNAAAGTAILSANNGRWCTLVSDGTNWIQMAGVI